MVLAALVALSGQFFGVVLGYNAPEEFKAGEKYYKLFKHILLLLLIVVLIRQSFHLISFILGLVLGFYYRREYGYFGLIAISALYDKGFQVLSSTLIFLYGLPYGTLIYMKGKYLEFAYNTLWFILALGLAVIFTNFIAFAAGALITILVLNIFIDWKGENALPYWIRIGRREGSQLERLRSV